MHHHSLSNLLNAKSSNDDQMSYLVSMFRNALNNEERSKVCDLALDNLSPANYTIFLQKTYEFRRLNPAQSHKIKTLCSKLNYYSITRDFTSKKSGKYQFRVAFLTLTAPACANAQQVLAAFEAMLDYLRRTAKCVYVGKKELGEESKHLHFHLLVNNFIPYYIVEWKWRKLLMGQGVEWPLNNKGQMTSSHYRIEIPKSKKQIAHYIAKYMSKAYELPKEYGYISCHSKVLDECKETVLIENDIPQDELQAIMSHSKVIRGDYVTHVCCDLLSCKKIAPRIGAIFEEQYISFAQQITMPQRFFEC
jgi:hypothetical protein